MSQELNQFLHDILYDPSEPNDNLPPEWPVMKNVCYEKEKEHKESPLYDLWASAQIDWFCSGENVFGLLLKRAQAHPQKPAIIWLDGNGDTETVVTFEDFVGKIRAVSYFLQDSCSVKEGDRVVLCYPPGIDFMVGFWACLSLNAIAVPVCPPDPFVPTTDIGIKLSSIITDCDPLCCLTNTLYSKAMTAGKIFVQKEDEGGDKNDPWHSKDKEWIVTDSLPPVSDDTWDFSGSTKNEGIAFLQYTSGSTGQAKGVKVTYSALLQNLYFCLEMTHSVDSFLFYKHSVAVSWLPTFHDMGLIGFHIVNMIAGATAVSFSPIDFIKNPILWLKVMSRYKRVVSGAPPFALDLCCRKVKEKDFKDIDLRRVSGIVLGAEPIRPVTLDKFTAKFKLAGFNENAFLPCYGLAENCLYVVGKKSEKTLVRRIHIDREKLKAGKLEQVDKITQPGILTQELISSGELVGEEQESIFVGGGQRTFQTREPVVVIVDPTTQKECAEGVVGEIWVAGTSLSSGYYNKDNHSNFGNLLKEAEKKENEIYVNNENYKFCRSGDLGAVKDSHLFITGRMKDMIIINGTNYYPQDIEALITDTYPALKPGSITAISVEALDGSECLAVLAEVRNKDHRSRRSSGCSQLARSVLLNTINAMPSFASLVAKGLGCRSNKNNEKKAMVQLLKGQYSESKLHELMKSMRINVMAHFGVPVKTVVLLSPKSIKRTSSGKLSRAASKSAYLNGDYANSTVSQELSRGTQQPKKASGDPEEEKLEVIKRRIIQIVAEELDEEKQGELLGEGFDENATLDQYGLDSVAAVRLAERLTDVFKLKKQLSVFMFIRDPTLNGVAKVILKLQAHVAEPTSEERAEEKAKLADIMEEASDLPCILGIGTVVPETGGSQEESIAGMKKYMQLDKKKEEILEKIGSGCRISRRHTVHKDPFNVFWGKKGIGNDEGMDKRNAVYKVEAPKLALKACEKAIADWGGDRASITHVVSVTCTGILVPGLEFHVMQGLSLAPDTQRLSITFMGCFGALAGLKTARAIACSSPKNRVLVVCCELCSLHMQLRDDIDNLVGSSLFSDGCGAFIVGAQPTTKESPIFELHSDSSAVIPDTLHMMKWDLTSTGFIIGLDKGIPGKIFEHMESFCDNLLTIEGSQGEIAQIHAQDCVWAIHPGGPMIITSILDCLHLTEDHAASSWKTLNDFGNMSSATLVFVWDRIREERRNHKKWVPALAFGPGLNVEGALMRNVSSAKEKELRASRRKEID